MSLSDPHRISRRGALRAAIIAAALTAPLVLAGCSGLRPVYGPDGVASEQLAFGYAEPGSRLDQIIIQDLSLRLGSGGGPDAPKIRISAAAGARTLTRTAVSKPSTQREVAVTASYVVAAADGSVLVSGRRRATAQYATSGQVLADEAARQDAEARAARAVADTIRLSILAELAAPVREQLVIR